MHWGSIIVTPGHSGDEVFTAGGNPYGSIVTATGEGVDDAGPDAIAHQVRRLVQTTQRFIG